ncbi:MAG: hypothetical protein COA53_03695 [Rhodobacteraceae bacterium]|nr:MAG: hypothetical protein COA53_03695 [Paracoccaceae bacterium]
MTCEIEKAPLAVKVLGVVAILFGVLTLYSGGSTLFIDGKARAAAGNIVGFVLWFNFLIGFAYIRAGVWLVRWQKCGIKLSTAIAGATLLVFALLGILIMNGGAYEQRTVGAMILRSGVWIVIAGYVNYAWRKRAS